MPKLLCIGLTSLAALAVVFVVSRALLVRALHHEPAFYRQALLGNPQEQETAGDEFEERLLELRNDSRQPGVWQLVLTEEQINGWLARDLPEKMPELLEGGIHDPRISFGKQTLQVAARYEHKTFPAVISCELELGLALEPNTLAIRFRRVRAGSLPAPMTQLLDRLTNVAREAAIPLRWSQIEGDPVALLSIPSGGANGADPRWILESIALQDGMICLSGHTEGSEPAASPGALPSDDSPENVTVQR